MTITVIALFFPLVQYPALSGTERPDTGDANGLGALAELQSQAVPVADKGVFEWLQFAALGNKRFCCFSFKFVSLDFLLQKQPLICNCQLLRVQIRESWFLALGMWI